MEVPLYIKYPQDVLSGKVVAGELVKLSCDRFFRFMENDEYEFREKEVKKVVNLFKDLRHTTGRHAGAPFVLEPWEEFAVASICGFYRKDDGTRLTKSAYLELARKNGKSAFMAGLALWALIADGEMSAEVDFAANSKDQAKILFKLCKNFARSLDPRGKYLEVYRDKILFEHTLSEINVFASDDSKLDGYNASFFCLHHDSLVSMTDGSQKKIRDVKVGDCVLSYDVDKRNITSSRVVWAGKTKRNAELVKYDNLICTPDHLIYNPEDSSYKEARHTTSVMMCDGAIRGDVRFECIDEVSDVYDITLDNIHNFFADGILVHNCLDEYHSAKSQALLDVLVSSQGMRESPLGLIITTAGFDKLGPCYEYRSMCVDVLHGFKKDDSLFPLIYCLDEGDDWKDESVWAKANPNLGITVRKPYLREQVQKAINQPSNEVNVKTKNLNVWCDASDVWIPEHYILAATKDVKLEDFYGRDCWIGVDLSSTSDLTAVAFMCIIDDKPHFHVKYYLPEAALSEKRFKEQYNAWRRAGYLTITHGNVVDYDYILNDIMDIQQRVNIVSVAYDSWNAISFATNATEAGLPMEPFSQALGNFNRPTKEMERLLLSDQCVLDNNVITRHCFRNVVLARDRNGNVKPSKQFAEKRIDGTIAILQCLGVYFTSPRYGEFY